MPRVGRRLGTTLLIAIVAVAGLFAFAPREPLDLDSYLRDREAVVGGITPGTEKRILWAGAAGARTDWAVVYLHGFSATSEEIRPVPDRVAAGLGANLYFTRLAGYGLATAVLTWPFARALGALPRRARAVFQDDERGPCAVLDHLLSDRGTGSDGGAGRPCGRRGLFRRDGSRALSIRGG